MKLNELIKEKRHNRQMTQQELADILFLSPKTISKWETGRGIPEASVLPDLAKALEITPDEILGSVKDSSNENKGMDPGIQNATIISIFLLIVSIILAIVGYSNVKNYQQVSYEKPIYFILAIIILFMSIFSYFLFENLRVLKIGVTRYDKIINRNRFINIWFIVFSIFPLYFFFVQPIRVYPEFFIQLGCYIIIPTLLFFLVKKLLIKKR
jgi:transcriptional regulator with XRE-family HTH domain